MSTLVMKFGGTSVGMTTGLTQVLSIVLYERERWDRLLIVVSALEGVTDALLEAAHLAQLANRRGYRRIVATLRTRHLKLIEYLPLGVNERAALQADIDRLLFDMLDTCQLLADQAGQHTEPEAIDAVIGVGERLAARIVASLLRQNGLRGVAIDATDLIITDMVYGNATPNIPITRERIAANLLPMLDRNILPIITGFIGSTATGKPTTLGRGGSDYTASVLATCTDADEVWIWTDVDGMMSADPRDIPSAQVIPSLSYTETAELAYFGARILHSRMIAPLHELHIPVRVRNIFKPQGAGTLISDNNESAHLLKAVTMAQSLGMFAPRSGSPHSVIALVDEVLFKLAGSRAEVVITAQSSWQSFLCFVIPTSAGHGALHSLEIALEELTYSDETLNLWTIRPVSVLTIIGSRLDDMHSAIASIFAALDGIRILALSQGPSRCSFSLVVETADGDEALNRVHGVIRAD
jgi:aspartate kinase